MNSQRSELLIPAPLPRVRELLLRPLELPEWNSAFVSLTGPGTPATGLPYDLTVRGGLRGTFRYEDIGERQITARWQVAGFEEAATWRLEPHGDTTRVVHEISQRGPLARLLSGGFRGVTELRLRRLAERAASA
jgi:hypothetical protein